MPTAWYSVQLDSPPQGVKGETAANMVGGGLNLNPAHITNGVALVEANSETEAIAAALEGTVTVDLSAVNLPTTTYSASDMSASGGSAFHVIHNTNYTSGGWQVQLEDLAAYPTVSDWDYNDFYWDVTVFVSPPPEGNSGGSGGSSDPGASGGSGGYGDPGASGGYYDPGASGGSGGASASEAANVLLDTSMTTVSEGGTFALTATVTEMDTSNGTQTPTGTITFSTFDSATSSWITLGTATLIQTTPGEAVATLVVDPVTLAPGSYGLYAGYPGDSWFYGMTGMSMITVAELPEVSGDLDIIDSNGNEVAEDKETSPGGWVAVNNDNDNYNFDGDAAAQATSLVQKYDKDESETVAGENDLVQIKVHDLQQGQPGGFYYLWWSSEKIKVWKTPDKTGLLTPGLLGDNVVETSYWVEGLDRSSSSGAETIELKWCSNDLSVSRSLDTVGFTVYEVSGATNVPGYSAYKYQVWSPVVQYDLTPNVVSVTGGQKQSEFAGGTGGAAGITMQATVLWDAGPLVGKVRVTPGSAVSNFFTDREVNVVKIAFSSGGADNKLVFNNPPFQDATILPGIRSANFDGGDKAMSATLKVTHIESPVVNAAGFQRGVRFMEYGFIQNVTITARHADYDNFATGKRQRVYSMEGHSYLDNEAAEVPFEPTPWYGVAYESPEQDPVGVGNLLPATILEEDDTPVLAGTNHMRLTVPGPNGQGAPLTDYVDRFWMTSDFGLFFAVRTREDSLSSQTVYTQRASAYWTFDGTGTINQGDPNKNFAGKGDWQAIAN